MDRFIKTIRIFSVITILILISLTGCTNEKNIILTNDFKSEEGSKEAHTLERIKELKIDSKKSYQPIYWKDKSHVIALDYKDNNKLGIVDINIENSEITKINELDTVGNFEWIQENIENLPFIHDNNLCLYNIKENSTREIYNFQNEEIESNFNHKSNIDMAMNSELKIIKGSNNYISFVTSNSGKQQIKIIDIETNKSVDIYSDKDLDINIFYSKLTNKFYSFSLSQTLYSFGFENSNDLNVVTKVSQVSSPFTIDEKGEFAYYTSYENKSDLMKYDLKNNKVIKVEGIYANENNNNGEGMSIINITGEKVLLRSWKNEIKDDNSGLTKGYLLVGILNNDKINVFGKTETNIDDKSAWILHSIVNKEGSEIFNVSTYTETGSDESTSFRYTVEKIK
ncbi:MAG: hypothetical protein AB6733_17975 [Clostridiaceae bacterium]